MEIPKPDLAGDEEGIAELVRYCGVMLGYGVRPNLWTPAETAKAGEIANRVYRHWDRAYKRQQLSKAATGLLLQYVAGAKRR